MIKGLYTNAAGMYPRHLEEEIAANNLANMNTTGFKKDAVHFRQVLDSELSLSQQLGSKTDITDVQEVLTNFTQGDLKATDNPLDVAINGEGFFVVLTQEGERYTRDGHFHINTDGELVTQEGHPVIGDGGAINLLQGDVQINNKGEIYQNGEMVDQIRLVTFQRPYPLLKEGENLFSLNRDVQQNNDIEKGSIQQGFLETSNVNPISEMIKLISISKAFEAGQKSIQSQNQTLRKAVNTVGKF